MEEVITYVGIDAHKRELHVAMLIGRAATPVTWTVENDSRGYRGPEVQPLRPDTFRILCVGDSITFGFCTASPTPMLRTIFSRRGTAIRFA